MITLILDNVRSMHNVGSILRTSDGFGVAQVICVGITPYPKQPTDTRLPHVRERAQRQIAKTALGAELTVPCTHVDSFDDIDFTSLPVTIVGLEQTAKSIELSTFKPPQDFILIVGNEPTGMSEHAMSFCSDFIEIPMAGSKESFNVSVATGIALYGLTVNSKV